MINPQGLLYIEPVGAPTTPIVDDLTCRMAAALNRGVGGTFTGHQFSISGGWRGSHTCSCGANSTNQDYQLPNGWVTNSLAVHYLACHRHEVPEQDLRAAMSLPGPGVLPSEEQIRGLRPQQVQKRQTRGFGI